MVDPIPVVTFPGLTPIMVTGFPTYQDPYTNVIAANYRDGTTFAQTLEQLSSWVSNDLIDQINTNETALQTAWDAEVAALVTAINTAIDALNNENHTDYLNLVDQINAAIANLNDVTSQVTAATDAAVTAASISATAAAASASAANDSATTATTDANNASTSATSAQSAAQAAAISAFGMTPIGAVELGPRFVFLGDQITLGSMSTDGKVLGGGFVQAIAALANGKIILVKNAGVNNDTTANMLARYDTDITPINANFDTVFLLAGTNDYGNSFTTWIANMTAIINKVKASGKGIVIGTLPPNNGSIGGDARKAAIIKMNAWIKRYAVKNRIPIVDFYKDLVDPASGNWIVPLASFYSVATPDGTVPNAHGSILMGSTAITALTPLLDPATYAVTALDNYDSINLVRGGLFSSWSGNFGLPTYTGGLGMSILASAGTGTGIQTTGSYWAVATVNTAFGESGVMQGADPKGSFVTVSTVDQRIQYTLPNPAGSGQLSWNIYTATSYGGVMRWLATVPAGQSYIDTHGFNSVGRVLSLIDGSVCPVGWTGTDLATYPEMIQKIDDGSSQGSIVRITANSSTNNQGLQQTITAGLIVGNKLAVSCRWRHNTDTVSPIITINFMNGSTQIDQYKITASNAKPYGWALYYAEAVVPANTTSMVVKIEVGPSTGLTGKNVDFSQFGIYDLTAMGIL